MKGNKAGYVMVLAAALMWGSIGIFVKGISGAGVSSQTMAAFRLLTGAVMMAPILVFMGCRGAAGEGAAPGKGTATGGDATTGPLSLFRCDLRSFGCCVLVGILGLAISNTCYYECMGAVGVSTASVLLYTSPVFGCILGRVLYREGVTANKLIAIACNIAGCALAVTDGDLTGFHFSAYGVGMGVLAGFLGAMLAVFSRMATARIHPLSVTFWGFVCGGAFMAALSAPWGDLTSVLSPEIIALFAGFGLIPTALAYVLYMQGLSMGLETSKVPVVASFETVASVLVGIGVYAESAGAVKVAGIALVLTSIAVMNADLSHLRQTAFAQRVAESMGFTPNRWWNIKAGQMEALFEPWYLVR